MHFTRVPTITVGSVSDHSQRSCQSYLSFPPYAVRMSYGLVPVFSYSSAHFVRCDPLSHFGISHSLNDRQDSVEQPHRETTKTTHHCRYRTKGLLFSPCGGCHKTEYPTPQLYGSQGGLERSSPDYYQKGSPNNTRVLMEV